MSISICGGEGIYLPPSHCEDCASMEARLKALEEMLEGVKRVTLSKTDDDSTQTGFFLGDVRNG